MTLILILAAVIAVCIYLGFGLCVFWGQPKILYRPLANIRATPAERGLDYEDVCFSTVDGVKLNGWYVPAANGNENGNLTVLFCHGNGGNIGFSIDTLKMLHDLDVNCFAFDYRGYGRSEGVPTEQGTYNDAAAAYRWLVNSKGAEPNTVVVFGRSLGGCVAAELVSKVVAAGMWLESAFTSFDDIGSSFYPYFPVRWFTRYNYETMRYLLQATCPVLVVHSPEDEVVPFEMGRRLYHAAPEPKQFVEIAGRHNEGFLVSNGIYTGPVSKWLEGIRTKQLSEAASMAGQAAMGQR